MKIAPLFLIAIIFAACASMAPTATLAPQPTATLAYAGITAAPPTQSPTLDAIEVKPTSSPQPLTTNSVKLLSDRNLGISFAYPSNWEYLLRAPEEPAGVTLHGPALGQGPEPIIFAITVDVEPDTATSVGDIVGQQLAQVPADLRGGIRHRSLNVAGEPAEELIGLPSLSGAIETFILHKGQLYLIILQPYDEGNESLMPFLAQARSVYDGLLSSWKFLK